MLEPSEELGRFVAQCMYEELEKIARVGRVASLANVEDLVRNAAKMPSMRGGAGILGSLRRSGASRARQEALKKARRDLSDVEISAIQQSRSSDPSTRQAGFDALKRVKQLDKEISDLSGFEVGGVGLVRGREVAKTPKTIVGGIAAEGKAVSQAAAKPKKKQPGALVRARNTIGNIGLAGLGGYGAYQTYNALSQPKMPTY